ncbi:MAG: class I SAM-dependent methyltransferase [Pseudomonadota bacterium]
MTAAWPIEQAARLLADNGFVDRFAWHAALYQFVTDCQTVAADGEAAPQSILDFLTIAVQRPDVTRGSVPVVAMGLLLTPAECDHLVALGTNDPKADNYWFLTDRVCRRLLTAPLLHELLMAGGLHDGLFEAILTTVRARLARGLVDGDIASAQLYDLLPLLNAMAVGALLSEHAWPMFDEEAVTLDALIASTDADHDQLLARLLIIGSYQRLDRLPLWVSLMGAETEIEGLVEDGLDRRVQHLHWDQPQAWRRHAEAIPILVPIEDQTSAAVAEQYEQNPYPRWSKLGQLPPLGLKGYLAQQLGYEVDPSPPLPGEVMRALVAGCGTGRHAITVAQILPEAKLDAVDLSRQSLGYASMMASSLNLGGRLKFWQADILGLPTAMAERGMFYDVVESVGVIHHMAAPADGLRALVDVLRPGGWLKLGLYSAAGRMAVNALRSRYGAGQDPDNPDALRTLRREILLDGGEDLQALRRTADIYSLSGFRDLLFHRQEHQYTVPGLAMLLQGAGLEFMGMAFADPAHRQPYFDMFPEDQTANDLDRWAAVEAENPTMFAGMYNFWCRKPG